MGVDHMAISEPIVEQTVLDLVSNEGYPVRVVVLRDQQFLTLKFEGNIDTVNNYTVIEFDNQPLPLSYRPVDTQHVVLPLSVNGVIVQATMSINANGNIFISTNAVLNAPVGIPPTVVSTLLRHD